MVFAFDGDVQFAFDDEHHGFRIGVQLRALAAAFRGQFDDVLGERFGKTGQRAGDDPHAHLVPKQVAGDDVTHHAFRDDGIGFGEHGTVSQQLGLSRVPTVGGEVRMVRHGRSRLVVLSPCLEPHRPVRRRGCGHRIGRVRAIHKLNVGIPGI